MASISNTNGQAISSQPYRAEAVTPSDSVDLTRNSTLYVGGAGNISIITAGGDTVTLTAIPAGSFVPVLCSRVRSTSTTATSIVALS